jgi:hypothetical protein
MQQQQQLPEGAIMFQQLMQQQAQIISHLTGNNQDSTTPSSKAKLNLPLPTFHGREHENVSTWAFQVKNIFDARNIPEETRLQYTANILQDAALQWYFNRAQKAEGDPTQPLPNTWTKLIEELKKAFEAPNQQQLLRNQLQALKQTSSVQQYLYKFRNILGQIQGMADLDQVHYFIQGLKGQTKQEVAYKAPQTLDEAASIAIRYDSAHFNSNKNSSFYKQSFFNGKQSSTYHLDNKKELPYSPTTQPTPMELDLIQKPNKQHYSKKRLSQETKDQLRATGACFYCREVGHIALKCPNKSTTQQENFNSQ